MAASNKVFISYRRAVGFAWARLVWQDLADHGIEAFLDLESLQDAGHFDEKILNQIAARPYFLPVLAPGSLERCVNDDDWLRREIDYAAATDRAFVPLIVDGFDLRTADRYLPEESASALVNSNGVGLVAEYFSEGMRRLREDRLKRIDLPVRQLSANDREFAEEARRRAARTELPPPTVVPPSPIAPVAEPGPFDVTPESGATRDQRGVTPRAEPDEMVEPRGAAPAGDLGSTEHAPGRMRSRRSWAAMATVVALVVLVGALGMLALTRGDGATGAPDESPVESPDPSTAPTTGGTEPTSPSAPSRTATTVEDETLGSLIADGAHLSERMVEGVWMRSNDDVHTFGMTSAGSLVAETGGEQWEQQPATDSAGDLHQGGSYWIMQSDGNLVLYDEDDAAVWSSKTNLAGEGDEVELELFDEDGVGVLQIRIDREPVWTCRSDACPTQTGQEDPDPVDAEPESSTPTTEAPPPPTTECTDVIVPDVTGRSAEEARTALRDVGLSVSEVSRTTPLPTQVGRVIRTDPRADECAPANSTVVIHVGTSPTPTVPPLGPATED